MKTCFHSRSFGPAEGRSNPAGVTIPLLLTKLPNNHDTCTSEMAKQGLILTGFMGVGKSTAGLEAAEQLGINYFDTDNWMEKVLKVDIPHLVKTNMSEFRKIEAETLDTMLSQEPAVISTGGGIVSTELGRNVLFSTFVPVVWLQAPFEVAAEHVANDTTGRERPLFADLDAARVLFEERQQWYEETAEYIVNAAQPFEQVVQDIVAIGT